MGVQKMLPTIKQYAYVLRLTTYTHMASSNINVLEQKEVFT